MGALESFSVHVDGGSVVPAHVQQDDDGVHCDWHGEWGHLGNHHDSAELQELTKAS